MPSNPTIVPIYTTRGDAEAYLVYPYLFNAVGEWVGWITPDREIYSVLGYYVGFLTNDPRILRKRALETPKAQLKPPRRPGKLTVPATVPLAPLMRELRHDTMDVLLEDPDLLHTLDAGELRQDLD